MAEDKKSFILYADQITIVKKLVLQDRKKHTNYAGELFLHILEYVNDLNPEPIDFIVDMAFEPIKLQLKRDLRSWEETKESKSNGARLGNLKRWNKDLYDRVMLKEITIEEAENIVISRKVSHSDSERSHTITQIAVNDNVNDTVNDTVNVNDTVINNNDCVANAPREEISGSVNPDSLKNPKEKRKKVAPKKEKVQPPEFWQNYVDMWFNFYKAEFPISPTFNATEGKHLKSIVTRFEKMAKEKDVDGNIDHKWTLDRAMRTFEKFLNNAWGDKWLKEHFLLKNLASNYDSIISKKATENGNQQKQSTTGGKKAARFSIAEATQQANARNS